MRRHWIERNEERHRQHARTTYQAFLADLIRIHPMTPEMAERTALSVLWALEQRLIPNEAQHLEAQLPSHLRALLAEMPRVSTRPIKFGHLDLIEWLANDLSCPVLEAERRARAVFQTVRHKISVGEADDVAAELPEDLALLWRHPA
jgi:uncharacterized protein (DUF2267 family)